MTAYEDYLQRLKGTPAYKMSPIMQEVVSRNESQPSSGGGGGSDSGYTAPPIAVGITQITPAEYKGTDLTTAETVTDLQTQQRESDKRINEYQKQILSIKPGAEYYTDPSQTRWRKGNLIIMDLESAIAQERAGKETLYGFEKQVYYAPPGMRYERTATGYTGSMNWEEYYNVTRAAEEKKNIYAAKAKQLSTGLLIWADPSWWGSVASGKTGEYLGQFEYTHQTKLKQGDVLGTVGSLTWPAVSNIILPFAGGAVIGKALGAIGSAGTGLLARGGGIATKVLGTTMTVFPTAAGATFLGLAAADVGYTAAKQQTGSLWGDWGSRAVGEKLLGTAMQFGSAYAGYKWGATIKTPALFGKIKDVLLEGYTEYAPQKIQTIFGTTKQNILRYDPWFSRRYTPTAIKQLGYSARKWISDIKFQSARNAYIKGVSYYGQELYPIAQRAKAPFAVKESGLYKPSELKIPYLGYSRTITNWNILDTYKNVTPEIKTQGRFLYGYDIETGNIKITKLATGQEWQNIFKPTEKYKEPSISWGVKEPGKYYLGVKGETGLLEISKIPRAGKPLDIRPVDITKRGYTLQEPKTIDMFNQRFYHTPGRGEVFGIDYGYMKNIFKSTDEVFNVKPSPGETNVMTKIFSSPKTKTIKDITQYEWYQKPGIIIDWSTAKITTGRRNVGGYASAYGYVPTESIETGEEVISSHWQKPSIKTNLVIHGIGESYKYGNRDISMNVLGLGIGSRELNRVNVDTRQSQKQILSLFSIQKQIQAQQQVSLTKLLSVSDYYTVKEKPPKIVPSFFDLPGGTPKHKKKRRDEDELFGMGKRLRVWKIKDFFGVIK